MARVSNDDYYLINDAQDHRIEDIFVDSENLVDFLILQDNKIVYCNATVHINKFLCDSANDKTIYICGDIVYDLEGSEHFKYPYSIEDFFELLVHNVKNNYTISFPSHIIRQIFETSSFYKSNTICISNDNQCQGFLLNENLCRIGTFNSIQLIYNKTDDNIDTTLKDINFEYKYTDFNYIAFNMNNSNIYSLFKLNRSYYIDDNLSSDSISDIIIPSIAESSITDMGKFFREKEFQINNLEFIF